MSCSVRGGLAALLLSVVCAGCGGEASGGVLELVRAEGGRPGRELVLELPEAGPGQLVHSHVTVRNVGTAPLTLVSLDRVDGEASYAPGAGEAVFQADFPAGATLSPGGALEVALRFRPPAEPLQEPRAFRVVLALRAEGGRERETLARMALEARAVPAGCALPASLDFGPVALGEGVSLPLPLHNPLSAPVLARLTAIHGEDSEAFAVADTPQGPFEVPAQGTREVTVRFAPAGGGLHTAVVGVQPHPACEERPVLLQGEGLSRLVEVEEALDFGGVRQGEVGQQTLTLRNLGARPVQVWGLTLEGSAAFALAEQGGPLTLDVGAVRALPLEFRPAAEGEAAATLSFETDVPTQAVQQVALRGLGLPADAPP